MGRGHGMINIKIEVNGITVVIIEGSNVDFGNGMSTYFYRGMQFPINRDEGTKTFSGHAVHARPSGIILLAERILRDIAEKS